METHKWIATGRVQGVGFRYYTYILGNKYDLRGWVKNLPDGSVEIMVQGDEENVEDLRRDLIKGNAFIKVRELQERIVEEDKFLSFEIRY